LSPYFDDLWSERKVTYSRTIRPQGKHTMAIILTGPKGQIAFWAATPRPRATTATHCPFPQPIRRAFARLSAFAANGNHAPAGHEGALTHDEALDFLNRLALGG
jgi:hypothetical protein